MGYDELLADRVRKILEGVEGITEKKMFGGLAFMLNGYMGCGIINSDLMARVPKDEYEKVLDEPFVKVMDFTGKPLRGMIFVDQEGIKDQEFLTQWVTRSIGYVRTLPPK